MGVLKFVVCTMLVFVVIASSCWSVCIIGKNFSNSRKLIGVWSAMASFVVTLFIAVMVKSELYAWFYNHPESYETPSVAADRGICLFNILLINLGVALAYFLWVCGNDARREE